MDFGITGRVAMVAAASKGIGLATARALAAEGCQISICGRNEETLEAAAESISPDTRSYVVDVTQAEDLAWWHEQTVADLGPVDILVTNTGGPPAGAPGSLTDEQWQLGVDSTLLNIERLSRLVIPTMRERKWGRVVHITSLVAKEPNRLLTISSTLRAGIMALTRLQGAEFGPDGVTVNGVLPGHTLTDRQLHLADIRSKEQGISPEAVLAQTALEIPLRRLADASEIAAAVAFLCSQPAGYINGVSLLVDGGLTKGMA
ncbi:MAG: SDR family oxidoreductase [Armatimonadetes bacterium]|nr:SDR family oxidoreductase [Armatimonadota bacterium]